MQSDTATVMAGLMDRMLGNGWFLTTWLTLNDWPDSWALVRDWKPADPRNSPTDLAHTMTFGDTILRDAVGFHADGTAEVRRIHVADGTTRWSQSGPAAETVETALALAAPKDCIRDSGYSDLPWGPTTTRVLALFRARGWCLKHTDEPGGHFKYDRGVGSDELDRPRFHQGQGLEPLGICPLSCAVNPELEVQLTGWRVQTGCTTHRGALRSVGFDDANLCSVLGRFEQAATSADLSVLAYCVVYGECSRHELDLSREYPVENAEIG